jgi:DNA-binding response OmpR family regulator
LKIVEGTKTILVADDEPKMARLVAGYLEAAGYRVLKAADGAAALDLFRSGRPDLVVLDVMMPALDGLEAARAIRREAETPIIFLTARSQEHDRVRGLELGADDYVVKPFSPRELVARVRAVLRRSSAPAAEAIERGGLRIDPVRREVAVDGAPRAVSSLQFDLLLALAREPGRVFTREQLLAAVRADEAECLDRTIDAHVKNLRKALGDRSPAPRFIGTVRGAGYRFIDQEASP